MWAIRILSGPQAGNIYTLKEGKTRIGRSKGVDLQVNVPGVSKEHLEITVLGEKLLFTDLNSSNGTYLNGVKVKGGVLKMGDKISIHNVIADIVVASEKGALATISAPKDSHRSMVPSSAPAPLSQVPVPMPNGPAGSYPAPYQQQFQAPAQYQQQFTAEVPLPPPPTVQQLSIKDKFNEQIDKKIMPALHQAAEQFEFRYILMGFVTVYIMMVTLLAIIPMKQITGESISIESRRRAITVARSLARGNEKVIRSGDIANFSTDYAWKEDGVDDVYVVSKEGRILAPAERVGSPPKEANFFKNVILRAGIHESSGEVNGKIAAAVPILGYDPDTQQNVAKAYAVIIYNPGSMTFDDGRAFSLFIQMLALAFVAGAILFFFLYRLVEYPYHELNRELDTALREGRDHAEIRVRFPVLQNMLTNINSLLARAANPNLGKSSGETGRGSKNHEYLSILQLIGFPALLITKEGKILKGNPAFEALTSVPLVNIENQRLSAIPDQAMQKNIDELMKGAAMMTAQVAMDKLEINGNMFALNCQALTTATGEVDCFFLTISPMQGSEDNAA
jgi:pSer/pThr/pTyr-binding forkhead associated (FHA) protein